MVFAALGLFASVLGIDLSDLEVFGIKMGAQAKALRASGVELIPGLLGLALIYSTLMFLFSLTREVYVNLSSSTMEFDKAITGEKHIAALRLYLLLTHREATSEQIDDYVKRARAAGAGGYKGDDQEIIDLLEKARQYWNPTWRTLEKIPTRLVVIVGVTGVTLLHGLPILLSGFALWYLMKHALGVIRLMF